MCKTLVTGKGESFSVLKWNHQYCSLQNVGYPHYINDIERRWRLCVEKRNYSWAQLATDFNGGQSKNISQDTIQMMLLKILLRFRRYHRGSVAEITSSTFTLELRKWIRHWILENFKRVTRSDKWRFHLHHVGGTYKSRQFFVGQLYTTNTTQPGDDIIMLWKTNTIYLCHRGC